MFSHIQGEIANLGLLNVEITGYIGVGGLAGGNRGTITNSYATGSIRGDIFSTGGLAGSNRGTITNSYATGSVSGELTAGGLVGENYGTIANSYAASSVRGGGRLVGDNSRRNQSANSYATGIC